MSILKLKIQDFNEIDLPRSGWVFLGYDTSGGTITNGLLAQLDEFGNIYYIESGTTTGINGVNGTSGSAGKSGTSGTSGTAGTSGISITGPNGTSGSSGKNGVDGIFLGTSGSSGSSGKDGILSGSSGTSGTGSPGSSGTSGTSGTSGATGATGTSGTAGTSGLGSSGTSGFGSGGGTSDFLARWTSTSNLGIGKIQDNNVSIGVNCTPDGNYDLKIIKSRPTAGFEAQDSTGNMYTRIITSSSCAYFINNTANGYGLYCSTNSISSTDSALYAQSTGNAKAGNFIGNVTISGILTKGSGSFLIDHPKDPENKFLYHSFVESPDMKNIYDGIVNLDIHGECVIELPDYFDSLNDNFRYQLTAIGESGPNLFISEEIENNKFKISGGSYNMKVSWQVTGVRKDPFAIKNRTIVEVDKKENEIGKYLHPEAYGFTIEEKGIYK